MRSGAEELRQEDRDRAGEKGRHARAATVPWHALGQCGWFPKSVTGWFYRANEMALAHQYRVRAVSHHQHMGDTGFHELLTARLESVSGIELDGMKLGMQPALRVAFLDRD